MLSHSIACQQFSHLCLCKLFLYHVWSPLPFFHPHLQLYHNILLRPLLGKTSWPPVALPSIAGESVWWILTGAPFAPQYKQMELFLAIPLSFCPTISWPLPTLGRVKIALSLNSRDVAPFTASFTSYRVDQTLCILLLHAKFFYYHQEGHVCQVANHSTEWRGFFKSFRTCRLDWCHVRSWALQGKALFLNGHYSMVSKVNTCKYSKYLSSWRYTVKAKSWCVSLQQTV